MNAGTAAEPEDDAFIRTAIRGMWPPEHAETFWDELAGDLDAAEDAAAKSVAAAKPVAAPRPPAPAKPPAHAPRRAPLRATDQVVVDAPAVAVPAMLAAAAKEPPPGGLKPPAPAPKVRRVDPLAGFKVRHDAATMPASMRRTSNVVLLTVALAAILVAIIAGLSLVKSRSDSGAPSPSETHSEAAPLPGGDLAGLPVQTR